MRQLVRKTGVSLLLAVCAACDLPPMISDTGYVGTWSRGNDRNVSIVAIAELNGRWFFRWTKHSFDGKLTIHCDWEGRCEERLNGALAATYAITTHFDGASRTLSTETIEERIVPSALTLRYTDVMEVKDAGLTLWNFTMERNGQHYEGPARPQRSFAKVSNSVADPPRQEMR